ncbi:MAG: hypothetical protein II903_03270 [Spirochaetales bacterium]|nr:hypothetical protein [Spirochaetales bacterium]
MNVWLYRKNSTTDSDVERILADIPVSYGTECKVFTDDIQNMDAYLMLKQQISAPGLLILMSLNDIGRTKSDVLEQASWLRTAGIEIVVMDCPSTLIFDNPVTNGIAFSIMVDMYRNMPDYRSLLPESTVKRLGRPKVEFPQGWDELYVKWRHRDITAKEFMELTGLKKGSFYHLISAYNSMAAGEVRTWKIG